jgi:mono/diheme cytochrome c family protein
MAGARKSGHRPDRSVRTDLIRLWLTVALAGVLASATVAVYQTPSERTTSDASVSGALVFQAKGCSGCHSVTGVAEFASIGPNLTKLSDFAGDRVAGMSAEDYITQSIRQPRAFTVDGFGDGVMPSLELSETEVAALVSFLLSER